MRSRTQLGQVIGSMMYVWDCIAEDPISQATGFFPDPAPYVIRTAEAQGWTLQDLAHELKVRGISTRWVYFSSLGMMLDVWELQEFRQRRQAT